MPLPLSDAEAVAAKQLIGREVEVEKAQRLVAALDEVPGRQGSDGLFIVIYARERHPGISR